MMRAGQSGIVCDFFMYGGKHSAGVERFGVEESVLRLVEEISQRMKTTGRGSFDYRIDLNSSLRVKKWYANKGVILGSSFSAMKSSSTRRRWDSKIKDHCNVACPDMGKEYNESMGCVDLNEMLISLYLVDLQTRKICYL